MSRNDDYLQFTKRPILGDEAAIALLDTLRLRGPEHRTRTDVGSKRLWLHLPTALVRTACRRAGADPHAFLKADKWPRFDLAVTEELERTMIEHGMIYGQVTDDNYFLEVLHLEATNEFHLYSKYQQIIGSRMLAHLDGSTIERLVQRLAGHLGELARQLPRRNLQAEGDEEALSQMRLLRAQDDRIVLPSAFLSQYAQIKVALERAGGKYDKRGFFRFRKGINVEAVLKGLLAGEDVNGKKDAQFFATPPAVAETLFDAVGPIHGLRVLEPSAGDGALADRARHAGAREVVVVENWQPNVIALREKGFDVLDRDFLALTPRETGLFDAVVMNPPFSARQDIAHVLHALSFLSPQGRLVAVMSRAFEHHGAKDAASFRELLAFADAPVTEVPAGAFARSGTAVATSVVEFDKADLLRRLSDSGRSPDEFALRFSDCTHRDTSGEDDAQPRERERVPG
jgi:predicted RNA methylase